MTERVSAPRAKAWPFVLLIGGGLFLFALTVGGWMYLRRESSVAVAAPRPPATVEGILHQWNFDEARDWHDTAFGPLKEAPARVVDLVNGWDLKPVGFRGEDWVSGREGAALQFPGLPAWLEADADLARTLGDTVSVGFWIRTSQAGGRTASEAPGLAGAVGMGRPAGLQWGWLDGEGHLNLSADDQVLGRTDRPVIDGQWHFVVFTRDAATGAGQVFLDGARVDARPGPAGLRGRAFRSVGRIEGATGAGAAFTGRIDKVTIFDRVLDEAQVRAFMDNHAPKSWSVETSGLAGGSFLTGSPLAQAYDAEGQPVTIRRWTNPAHGRVEPVDDGSFTYTPSPGFHGDDTFTVVVQDGHGGFHQSGVALHVAEDAASGGIPLSEFRNLMVLTAGGVEVSHPGLTVPVLADWDGDGLTDLLLSAGGGVWFHRNTGTKGAPVFAPGERLAAAGKEIASGDHLCPIAFADWNGDGRADLLVSDAARHLRVYLREAAGSGLSSAVSARTAAGAEFLLPDRRLDVGDWNGDGVPDVVCGVGGGDARLFKGAVQAGGPVFGEGETIFSGAYNLYPRFCDLDGNGRCDLVRGINWGGLHFWLDVGAQGLAVGGDFVLASPEGAPQDLRATDGAVAALGDLNGDGLADLVTGAHAGGRIYLAFGVRRTVRDHVREIESIFDAHPADLGEALEANGQALLARVVRANRSLAALIEQGNPRVRQEIFDALVAHVRKYPFLRLQKLELPRFRHVPSMALQDVIFLRYARPDTGRHRAEVADLVGFTGPRRDVFVTYGLALGDNAHLNDAQLGTIRDFFRHHPRILFPDSVITFDQVYGDGRGALVWTPDGSKNTFGMDVGNASEWAGDLVQSIEAELGKGASHGDYFTFVMGHEVTHSLDGYVNRCANRDLRRRWGSTLVRAAGPDVVAGPEGWIDWAATRQHFAERGLFQASTGKWEHAWSAFWEQGPGKPFRHTSFMRGGIDWFLASPQESLATQANHHWANAVGRLVGAAARFREGERTGLAPLKANLTEVVDFLDYQSAGLSRVAMPRPFTEKTPVKQVVWDVPLADLERDDLGRITRVAVAGRTYRFSLDGAGAVTNFQVQVDAPPAAGARKP